MQGTVRMGSTNSLPVAKRGAQRPRIEVAPSSVSSAGGDAVALAELAGLKLDPWQQHVLEVALGEQEDGRWSSFEVGLVVARQNGKTEILLARILAGLFLLGEQLIVFSAHEFKAAREAFYRLRALVQDCPQLMDRVEQITTGAGNEGVELKTGQRVRFVARTGSSGRGFTGDCVILDESFNLPTDALASLLPTLSARPNPQVWFASSAVDQMAHPNGLVLSRVRKRALEGDAGALAYLEWSADDSRVDDLEYLSSVDAWAQANPALGFRISAEHCRKEWDALPLSAFLVERLSIGDWPDPDGKSEDEDRPISPALWDGLMDRGAAPNDPVVFGVEVAPDRSSAAVVAAGWSDDGRVVVELVDRRPHVSWLSGRLDELVASHSPSAVVLDGYAQVDVDVETVTTGAADMAAAFARFVDACHDGQLSHLGQQELDAAVAGAETRSLSGGRAWKRVRGVDVSPLVAASLAVWGLCEPAEQSVEPFVFVS